MSSRKKRSRLARAARGRIKHELNTRAEKVARSPAFPKRAEAMDKLRNDRDQALAKLSTAYRKRLDEVGVEWGAERKKVWDEYDQAMRRLRPPDEQVAA